jgi:hypothetical protein
MNSNKECKDIFLLSVAKDLQNLKRCQKCAEEFQNEVENKINNSKIENDKEVINENNDGLHMEAKEDPGYDVDEIRFWNFIKNKGLKPNIIRTIVHKIPESVYVTRKCHYYVSEKSQKNQHTIENTLSLVTNPTNTWLDKETQTANQSVSSSEVSSISVFSQDSSKNISIGELRLSENYNIEDLILIEDEIDNAEDENRNENEIKKNNTKKNRNFKKTPRNKPKVIIEKVKEPVSTIIIVESDLIDRPQRNSFSNTTTDLKQYLKSDLSNLEYKYESNEHSYLKKDLHSASSSSSSSSLCLKLNLQDNESKLLRLTRSKAKLVNN